MSLSAIVEANPQMNATVIDLPSVVPVTQRFLEEAEMTDRVQARVTNIVSEPLTGPFDVAVLRNLIQVLSPADARRALSHIYQGIIPGGELYAYGNVLDNSRLTPEVIVLRSLIFLNSFDDGQAYTEQEYRDWLTEAGFVDIERVILPSAVLSGHESQYRNGTL